MTSALLGKAGKRALEKHFEQYAPADPLYEFYVDERGKNRRRKRDLPPGLSSRDAAILRKVKRRAHRLDRGFSLCGFRFGWTFPITLIPLVGDAAGAGLNYFLIVRTAKQADLPDWLVRRMIFNNAVSAGVSFIPLVGDVILAAYKANSRNAALLEEFLRIRGEEFIKMGGVVEEQGGKKGKKKKTTKGTKNVGPPTLTAHDVAEVKPGAGMTGAEAREIMDSNYAVGPPASGPASPPDYEASTANGKKASGSSGFGFFGHSKKGSQGSA